jgi:hypothetical protein
MEKRMKRLLIVLLCLPIAALGQGIRFDSSVMTAAANVPYGAQAPVYTIPFTSIYVCAYPASGNPCTNTVTVYSDQAMTQALDQPLQTDTQGRFGFWAAAGQYTYSAVSPTGKFMGTFIATLSPITGGGGGGVPAGNLHEFNAKQSSSAFQGTGYFGSDDKSLVSSAVPSVAHYVHNPTRSGPCTTLSCGESLFYGQSAPFNDPSNQPTGWGSGVGIYHNALVSGLGTFSGFGGVLPYEPSGGTSYKLQWDNVVFRTPGIGQTYGSNTYCAKPFDCAKNYDYFFYHGGQWAPSDEGGTPWKLNAYAASQYQGGFQLTNSPGTGATSITNATLLSPDQVPTNFFVYNVSQAPTTSGNITAYDGANHLLTVTTGSVTPPTTRGTTTGNITSPSQGNANGFSFASTVHVTLGTGYTNTVGNPVVFVCDNLQVEFPTISSITPVDGSGNTVITGIFAHGHPTGCTVVQGGTMGILDLYADRIGNNWKTSYFVFDATDTSHIHEATYLRGTRGFINDSRHNFGGGVNHVATTVVRSGNVITVGGLGLGQYNFGGQYVRLSGYTPSDVNGTYLASQLNANYAFTVASVGPDETATGGAVDVGGNVNSPDGATFGGGGFYIWPTAMIKQLGVTTTVTDGKSTDAYNNTVTLFPNNLPMSSGNFILALDDMQAKLEPITAAGTMDIPPTNLFNSWATFNVSGYGVATPKTRILSVINGNSWTLYRGGGGSGTLDGIIQAKFFGPSAIVLDVDAPVPLGSVLHINKNPMMGHGVGNQSFFPMLVDGIGGGGGGFVINYNPDTGTTAISSGTGNGVQTAITMTPTTLALGGSTNISLLATAASFSGSVTIPTLTISTGLTSTGAATFQSNVTVNGLIGTGNRLIYADSTGKLQSGPTMSTFNGKCTSPQTPTFVNGLATGCS